jgi:methionyl-tRNA formyltransferase
MKFALLITGYKGMVFLEKLKEFPQFIVTYDNKEGNGEFYQKIIDWGRHHDVPVFHKKEWESLYNSLTAVDKIFVVGWQFLIKDFINKLVVFHDSYLPERRGRCPTVGALMDKMSYLGASTFRPFQNSQEPDYGDVYYRLKQKISYPLSLQEAFSIVAELYIKMAHNILKEDPTPSSIDFSKSSFSMWRDEEDMRLDWSKDAEEINQNILTLSYPYDGAVSLYDGKPIRIKRAKIESHKNIINQQEHCGKIWKIEKGNPHIVCGKGILKILEATDESGNTILFSKTRKRFK